MKRRTSSGASSLELQWAAGELREQQPLNDAQTVHTGDRAQPAGVAHVRVVAAQLVGDRPRRRRQVADDAALAQQGQQRHQRCVRLTRMPHRRCRATAVRQVLVQELRDSALIEPLGRQPAQCHPMREVRHGAEAAGDGVGRVAAIPQPRDVRRNMLGQRAVEQPAAHRRVQRGDLGHGGLQKWRRRAAATADLCTAQRDQQREFTRRHAARRARAALGTVRESRNLRIMADSARRPASAQWPLSRHRCRWQREATTATVACRQPIATTERQQSARRGIKAVTSDLAYVVTGRGPARRPRCFRRVHARATLYEHWYTDFAP